MSVVLRIRKRSSGKNENRCQSWAAHLLIAVSYPRALRVGGVFLVFAAIPVRSSPKKQKKNPSFYHSFSLQKKHVYEIKVSHKVFYLLVKTKSLCERRLFLRACLDTAYLQPVYGNLHPSLFECLQTILFEYLQVIRCTAKILTGSKYPTKALEC